MKGKGFFTLKIATEATSTTGNALTEPIATWETGPLKPSKKANLSKNE
jgi:hypothetical protein